MKKFIYENKNGEIITFVGSCPTKMEGQNFKWKGQQFVLKMVIYETN